MFGLNSYSATTSARDYVDQLFGKSGSAKVDTPVTSPYRPPSFDVATGTTATDRALAKIVSLIWEMENGGGEKQTSVDESNGYILNATGTEEADKIDMKAISAFQISTGAGDDTVTVKAGSLAALDAGDGNDTVNLAAGYLADVDGGDGDDKIHIAGDLADTVSGGAGNDEIKISANAMLGISGGDGNDTLYLEGKRIFASGGAGDDSFTINSTGDGVTELSFIRGDGKDVVNTNAATDIRLSSSIFDPQSSGTGSALTPDDLDIAVSDNRLVLRVKDSADMVTINFDKGALEGKVPSFSFDMDNGSYVLRIR
jgi:Ca2+-binding RTX toxin-like protein